MEVPATLQASLIARLDRLPAAKQVAQIGAVIGREFAHILLAAVATMPEAQLTHGIETLVTSGLAFRRGMAPTRTIRSSMRWCGTPHTALFCAASARNCTGVSATTLEGHFPEIVETQPELLAHHFTQAALLDRAIEYWRRAGLRSVRRSAHSEAAAQFTSALGLLGKLPPSEQRNAHELDLTLDLAVPLIAVEGFGALRVEECALRAKELSDQLHGSPGRFAARRLAWNSCLMRQPVPKTVALARDLIELAESDESPAKRAVANRALAYSLLIAGEYREADEIFARGAALADTIPDGEFAVYGEHPSMVCRVYGGHARIVTGFPVSGARLVEDGGRDRASLRERAQPGVGAGRCCAHLYQIHHERHGNVSLCLGGHRDGARASLAAMACSWRAMHGLGHASAR